MINQKKFYIIKPPKRGNNPDKTIHQEEIEGALWKIGVNYYQLTKEEEEIILKLAKRF